MNILGTKNVIERLEEMVQAEIMMLEVLDLLDNQLMQGFGSYLDYEDELIKEIMSQVPEIETKDDAERFLVITSLVDRMIPVDNPEAHIMKASVAVTLFSNSKTYNKKEIVSNPFIKNIKIDDNNVAKKGKYELHNVEVYKGEVFEDDTDKIDGIIHIKSFSCVPEINAMPTLSKISEDYNTPILYLSFDGQNNISNIDTKIEAFKDMIKAKKNLL